MYFSILSLHYMFIFLRSLGFLKCSARIARSIAGAFMNDLGCRSTMRHSLMHMQGSIKDSQQ